MHQIADRDPRAERVELLGRLAQLQAENARLHEDNRQLRTMLDVHVARARSAALFGPIELSAGTSVGPRRRRDAGAER